MPAPQATPRVKKALLAAVAAFEQHRVTERTLYDAQEASKSAYATFAEKRDKAIELWKKDCQPNGGACYGHILLPDGRLVCLQEGAITIWDMTKL